MSAKNSNGRLLAFPRRGIAYVECLYSAVEQQGVVIEEGHRAGNWLWRNVRSGDTLHINWPSFFYYDEKSAARTFARLIRFIALMSVAKARGAQILWTAHNLYPHDGSRHSWMHRVVRKFMVAAASGIFVHGPHAAKLIAAQFPAAAGKIVTVPHGHWISYYPPSRSRTELRSQLGIADSSYVYGFIGGCKPYKGLEDLIEAFRQTQSDCVLLIAGEFQSDAYLQSIRERLSSLPPDRVLLLPQFLPIAEMQSYVSAIDALVLPYKAILTSGSVMLGLSFGRPVVVPDIGGVRDAMDERHGLLYDPDSPTALADALHEIRLRTYGADALIAHARTFEWSATASAIVTALEEHSPTVPASLSALERS